jgi:hypothetical protein
MNRQSPAGHCGHHHHQQQQNAATPGIAIMMQHDGN